MSNKKVVMITKDDKNLGWKESRKEFLPNSCYPYTIMFRYAILPVAEKGKTHSSYQRGRISAFTFTFHWTVKWKIAHQIFG